jgi:hypothetical protein
MIALLLELERLLAYLLVLKLMLEWRVERGFLFGLVLK